MDDRMMQGVPRRLIQRWYTRRDRAAQYALRLRPISLTLLAVAVLVVAVVTAVMTAWLYRIAGADAGHRIDAIRTGLTVGAGTGGAFALLLAFRRQRSTEIIANVTAMAQDREQEQRERAAAATEQDAVERRITELYTKAADQLGSDQAPVRLAGLYALERLAQNTESQRQIIVNVLCAYLRMPFTPPPGEHAPAAGEEERMRYARSLQERQVRLTAQCIVTTHLRSSSSDVDGSSQFAEFWPDISLDLTDAYLQDFDFVNCHVRDAKFSRAHLSGDANFAGAHFNGYAAFMETRFDKTVTFEGAEFSENVTFAGARFTENVTFARAQFEKSGTFEKAEFGQNASFSLGRFGGDAIFSLVRYKGDATLLGARFSGDTTFEGAQFDKIATFEGAQFNKAAAFGGVQFNKAATFIRGRFNEDTTFAGVQFNEEATFARGRFNEDVTFEGARFVWTATFEGAQFCGNVTFNRVKSSSDVIFDHARTLRPSPNVEQSWPPGWTTRLANGSAGEETEWLYLTRIAATS